MRTDTEGLLYQFPTVTACLCGETGVHSDDLMTSSCSLIFKDVEERAPRGIQDGFCEMMVFDHIADSQVFYYNVVIAKSIGFGCLEMVIAALPMDLEMGLSNVTSGFAPTVAPLLASAQLSLFAPERLLRSAIEAWVLDGRPFTIGQEGREPYVNADISMVADTWQMFSLWLRFAHNEGIPVPIRTQDQMCSFRRATKQTMQFDLERAAQPLGNDEMLPIGGELEICLVLAQLNGVPAIRLLKAGETYTRESVLFGGKKAFESTTEPIREHLDRRSRHIRPTTPFEDDIQLILGREGAILLILLFDGRQHLIIEFARLAQASHEGLPLLLRRIEPVLKRSHSVQVTGKQLICQMGTGTPLQEPQTRNAPHIPRHECRGFTARFDKYFAEVSGYSRDERKD